LEFCQKYRFLAIGTREDPISTSQTDAPYARCFHCVNVFFWGEISSI